MQTNIIEEINKTTIQFSDEILIFMRPNNFENICELQCFLDNWVRNNRSDGFIVREQDTNDYVDAIVDELMEFKKELPTSFKVWKNYTGTREKQLEEFVDSFFFIASWSNDNYSKYNIKVNDLEQLLDYENNEWETIEYHGANYTASEIIGKLSFSFDFDKEVLNSFIEIAVEMKFTREDILNQYWKKWNINLKRIKGDWTNEVAI